MGPKYTQKAIAKHPRIVWLDKKTMMAAEKRRFDFENSSSVQANNTNMLCGCISDTGLYSFCYRRIGGLMTSSEQKKLVQDQAPNF